MVCARARDLDMRPRVCAELPLRKGREGEQHERRGQQVNRWPPEYRWENATASIGYHDR